MNDEYAPKKGTKGYGRVLARGCRTTRGYFDFDEECYWQYPWSCDYCPIIKEEHNDVSAQFVEELEFFRPCTEHKQ